MLIVRCLCLNINFVINMLNFKILIFEYPIIPLLLP